MNPEDIKTTQKLIDLWDEVALEVTKEINIYNLFCKAYSKKYDCIGCPIYTKTNGDGCALSNISPYGDVVSKENWVQHFPNSPRYKEVFGEYCDAIEEQVEFLISLLPEEFQKEYEVWEPSGLRSKMEKIASMDPYVDGSGRLTGDWVERQKNDIKGLIKDTEGQGVVIPRVTSLKPSFEHCRMSNGDSNYNHCFYTEEGDFVGGMNPHVFDLNGVGTINSLAIWKFIVER